MKNLIEKIAALTVYVLPILLLAVILGISMFKIISVFTGTGIVGVAICSTAALITMYLVLVHTFSPWLLYVTIILEKKGLVKL
jgi:hypothetical protein